MFCANDLLALGLLQRSVHWGLSVPDDLAIVGYDDIEFAEAAAVRLTSVAQPRELLGRTAVELLLDEVATGSEHEHRHVVFTPELVVRSSTLVPDAPPPPDRAHGAVGTALTGRRAPPRSPRATSRPCPA